MSPEEREKWQALATKAREKLEIILDSGDCNPAVIARIAEIAADRGWGKPVQAVEMTGEDGGPIGFRYVDPGTPTTTGTE